MTEKASIEVTLFNAALAARHAGDFESAKARCVQVLDLLDVSQSRCRAIVHGELGFIHRETGELPLALRHYEVAVKASPKSQLPSLGLFHCLAELGELELGLAEVVRFVGLRDSGDYRELLSHGFGDDLPEGERVLADKARALLGKRA